MERPRGIHKLSNELLKDILDQVEADPKKFVSIDRRAYLSVESVKQPSPRIPSSQAGDVSNFRETCKRFAELGVPHQFTRITTRFSCASFERLDNISRRPDLAKHVRKFSYMVPFFYVEGRDHVSELLSSANFSQQDVDHLLRKVGDQKMLVQSGDDVASLRRAMMAFESLQHVQISGLQDGQDRALLEFIEENINMASQLVDLKWTPACIHAVRTMGEALLQSHSPVNRFTGPMINPQSALELRASPILAISSLAERLTCLELYFDAGPDRNERMRELSPLFKTVFTAAKNMQAIHIGFPSRSPIDLDLEEIFHNVQWSQLRAFGIQAWRLDADQIINIARRHCKTLRGLRLRDVLLREGSMWKDVLRMLHDEMELLEWVSLRRIDYNSNFNRIWGNSIELTDNDLMLSSDSDTENGDGYGADHDHISEAEDEEGDEEDETSSGFVDFDSDSNSNSGSEDDQDDDHGPSANELALSPDTPASAPWSFSSPTNDLPRTADELGDNGMDVIYEQRKIWEQWIVANPNA